MKNKLQIYYDEEGDFLELHAGPFTKGHFRDIADGISERIDTKTGKVTGIAILGFRKRFARAKGHTVDIPVKIALA